MTATNYDACLRGTLASEGGYSNDAGDPGGPTNYGITIHDVRLYINPNATATDVQHLTIEQAKTIYRARYWDVVAGDDLPAGLDYSTFDAGANSGVSRGLKWLQSSLGAATASAPTLARQARSVVDKVAIIKRLNATRLTFLQGLSTWRLFGRGWGPRVARVEATSVKMALTEAGLQPDAVKGQLQKEADEAKVKRNGLTKGLGTSTVGTGVTQAPEMPAALDVLHWSLMGKIAVGIIVAAAITWFAWHIIHNHQRAKAYADEASAA